MIKKLMRAKSDAQEIDIDEVVIMLHLACPDSKIGYFVFGAREAENNDVTLIGHVVGERYAYVPAFIQSSLRAIKAGDWFGEEVPAINAKFRPGPWKKIKRRYLR
jgi:hypothetical protein